MRSFTRIAILACLSVSALAAVAHEAGQMREDVHASDIARIAKVTRQARTFTSAEKFERMSAGAATSTKPVNANAFSHPSANLTFEEQERFVLGNGLFRKDWASSPSSTLASDGLGPLFNARSCQSCHIKDGRGHAPANPDDSFVSMLVRLSVPPDDEQERLIAQGKASVVPEPVYGQQIQDFAIAGLPAEGRVRIDYEAVPVALSGGEEVTLRKPSLSVSDLGYGPLHAETMLSARVAPPMIGLGLLESIHETDIVSREDAADRDGDGISGRAQWVEDAGVRRLGRFGWKAIEPTVRRQTAHAFSGDMGLSTPSAPSHWGDCTAAQSACNASPHGAQAVLGEEEVPRELLDLVAFYSRNLAVPARRGAGDDEVLAGKQVFYESGCASCHAPKYVTRPDAEDPALRFQLIWPYTDLLLHDMGEGLADHRPDGAASGREWRTPPLWGIGLSEIVSPQATYLHDGRARSLLEAVLWHGGEAQAARDRVVEMDKTNRDNLIRFLESL